MYVRKRIDIGWRDLVAGIWHCCFSKKSFAPSIEGYFSAPANTLATLSVRSGFDLFLSALALPAGSEILVSAVTIKDMIKIIEAHGLIAVPIDLDLETLSLRTDLLNRAITPKARILLVAHLFGARMDLAPILTIAKAHNLIVIEDCAQSFIGKDYCGNLDADIAMFSFGPIKTATALGGAIIRVNDERLLGKMRARQSQYPRQSRKIFFKRILKYWVLIAVSPRLIFQLATTIAALLSIDYDNLINNSVREFAGADLFVKIRLKPCLPLLALLARRLKNFSAENLAARAEVGREISRALSVHIEQPGRRADLHYYWLFPILLRDRPELIAQLREAGFDVTRGATNLAVVDAPDLFLEFEPTEARRLIASALYLPVYPELSEKARRRLLTLLNQDSITLINSEHRAIASTDKEKMPIGYFKS